MKLRLVFQILRFCGRCESLFQKTIVKTSVIYTIQTHRLSRFLRRLKIFNIHISTVIGTKEIRGLVPLQCFNKNFNRYG